MQISHRFKYFYSVIPKTGSASLRYALKGYADVGWPIMKEDQHVPLHLINDQTQLDCLDNYRSFSFVRNPYDRIYSGFLQDLTVSQGDGIWAKAKRDIFKDVKRNFSRYLHHYVAKADIENDWRWICFCPMYNFIFFQTRKINFIGKFEEYEESILKLENFLSLSIKINKALNVRESRPIIGKYRYIKYYTQKDIELVNELYSKDFITFGYKRIYKL